MVSPGVRAQFVGGLELLYGAHHQGARQAAENERTSTSPLLKRMLRAGAKQNLKQAKRLEEVFASGRLAPRKAFDPVMEAIKDANKAGVAAARDPAARDLANIAYGQLAAHFYIATYGTVSAAAEALGEGMAASLLQKTLDETYKIDAEFSRLAERLTRHSALPDYGRESAMRTSAAMHPVKAGAVIVGSLAVGAAALGLGKRTAS